jgi:NADPH:quinone reductase-like Zn-dependent oxidoreductase
VVALAEAGTLRPVIERTVALADVPAAIDHMEREHTRGKLVVTVQEVQGPMTA